MGPLFLWLVLSCQGKGPADSGWDPVDGDACLSCHGGIEQVHDPIAETQCVVCHGGDETALTKEAAHVSVPANYAEVRGEGLPPAAHGFIRDMPPDMLDALDPAYVRFINPGDIRAAGVACGSCHPDQVASVPNSVMTTNAGHYMPSRWYAGLQGRDALYGSVASVDPDFDGTAGTVASLETLPPPSESAFDAAVADPNPKAVEQVAYDHYLAKNCNTCHAAGYPQNNSNATYRSTGCSSCHVVYGKEGVYEGGDEAVPHNVPVYPLKHEITNAIPTEQCATCHYQGGRIGFLFRGIREGGFGTVPENAQTWDESVYTHTAGYYVIDEDTTNNFDETPPDVHYSAGMHCVDCHVGSDVHGDGRIYSTGKYQVDLRCEDCHGTVRQRATPDGSDVYRTSSGRPLTQLYTTQQGEVALVGLVDEKVHVVPQPKDLLQERGESSPMHAAMGVQSGGFTHTDSMTCDTCHNSVQQHCLGCHVTLDMRLSQTDYQTGTKSAGLTSGSRTWYTLDHIVLCQAPDGRAQTCNSSQQVQMSVVDGDGNMVLGEREVGDTGALTGKFLGAFRSDADHASIKGWSPFYQHTATDQPRACMECHRQNDSVTEWSRVKGVYGYGTGEFMLDKPGGGTVDALQFLDADGNATTRFVHEGTGPLSEEVRTRALGVNLSESQ